MPLAGWHLGCCLSLPQLRADPAGPAPTWLAVALPPPAAAAAVLGRAGLDGAAAGAVEAAVAGVGPVAAELVARGGVLLARLEANGSGRPPQVGGA
jgi:hypothetical protein